MEAETHDGPPVDPLRPLAGQWAVVAGGSKGIGRGIARRFAAAGAHLGVVARDKVALDAVAEELRAISSGDQEIITLAADVASRHSVTELFSVLRDRVPSLSIFVANAGTGHVTPFLELTAEEWDSVVALNLTGTVASCQEAARMMRSVPTSNSSIIVVSSIRALGARPGRLVYSATKAAVNQMVRVAALELAPYGIRINALSPGITETPLAARNPEAFREAVVTVPLGRAAQPEDLAEAALYLASPVSSFVTGINLVVDGGESLVS
jgi:3-oxoacyl-[acyl-carrier protein] reductase